MEPLLSPRGLLLDTYALVCALARPERMPSKVVERLLDPATPVYFSAASVWEIEIKAATGKLARPSDDVARAAREQGFVDLAMTSVHAAAAGRLPLHHRDPFDRMLAAQADLERLTLVTPDAIFAQYGVVVLAC